MARDNIVSVLPARSAAATAGTTTVYYPIAGNGVLSTEGPKAALFVGFSWLYETTEANADNTVDFDIGYTTDGTNFTTLFNNVNPNGLLNTSAPLVQNVNNGNAASSGVAGVDVAVTQTRIPAGATLRITTVTAGTGTIPAIQVSAFIKYL